MKLCPADLHLETRKRTNLSRPMHGSRVHLVTQSDVASPSFAHAKITPQRNQVVLPMLTTHYASSPQARSAKAVRNAYSRGQMKLCIRITRCNSSLTVPPWIGVIHTVVWSSTRTPPIVMGHRCVPDCLAVSSPTSVPGRCGRIAGVEFAGCDNGPYDKVNVPRRVQAADQRSAYHASKQEHSIGSASL